jgi:cytochrome P450
MTICSYCYAAIVRQATRDDVINDLRIKKVDVFLIATQNMHRDSRYWNSDPMKFLPERFLGEDKNPPTYAYMPYRYIDISK